MELRVERAMRKTLLFCAVAIALSACAEPKPYSYPPLYEAPLAPPQRRPPPPSPHYVAPTPVARNVKPLGLGPLTDKNVGLYMDGEEREMRAGLRGSGVGVGRPGDSILLLLRSDVLFARDSTNLSSRGAQILSEIAAVAEKYDSTVITANGYTDTADPPDRDMQVSQERADAVAKALVAAGIDAHRVAAHGLGATHLKIPTGPNKSEPRNRRVEILIAPKMAG
jgi:outer membrane protein OmpA-like peptidoglycan-associated protein